MKNLILLLIGISLLVMSGQAYTQDDRKTELRKPLNNPMYSTHNYKHPHLATAARRWDRKEGVEVRKPTPGDAQLANYKKQMPIPEPVGGITIGHTPSTNLAERNYKIQRLSEPKPGMSSSEYYVKKQRRTDTTVGE